MSKPLSRKFTCLKIVSNNLKDNQAKLRQILKRNILKEVDFLRNNSKSLIDIAVKEAEKASTNVVKVAIKTSEKTQEKVLNRL